ncbi:helix-turn-helix domain-containing protein [Streptomyces sp. NBC_00162]|uniref:helix-turn-helix domain-containing protein n=1 Tax=Streptomyces sp. NBC_00162 TaxID=2903629 RepID=UPI00214A937E|nr:transposase family protein [Streptomyces sp. NBC_00162]UUU44236.1 transposase family protein [Streptomyces sp. NBC_00162]
MIAELVAEVGPLWHERHQAGLESSPRKRAVGAGAKHRLVFIDRFLATLIHLRHGATHDVLACWFGVDRSTITRAIGEVRPLLAARGCTIATGIRLHTLAEVIDHLGASGQAGIIDGTEIRVRRPAVGRKDREPSPACSHTNRPPPAGPITHSDRRADLHLLTSHRQPCTSSLGPVVKLPTGRTR